MFGVGECGNARGLVARKAIGTLNRLKPGLQTSKRSKS